ncbi:MULTISPECIES: cation diffusion facilitator family transporter [unclassified Devosia]|uniref:cation diffusion facilitator family transporter n=1 Tax=unclassified Devosia TaxID=196773 RepID=UPI00145ECDE8|nr:MULTISPECIES: cation diffusion facilitator family transporter [unclassified Devosia]MBJ6987989.1 cation diffusion facilitator family transporter [Devosia sp. MC521]QMW62062.1 cation diffusion facilitator family transporter [Devosia sp. MC521]
MAHPHDHSGHSHDETDHDHEAHQHAPHAHDHAGHSHDHAGHDHTPKVSSANERAVLIGLTLTGTFMVIEVIGGLLSGSLALLADAGHMLTDTIALFLSWLGFRIGKRVADSKRSFGYARVEVLAGLINALTLFGIVVWILYEAFQRFMAPDEVLAGPMFAVAVAGLLINLLVLRILGGADKDHVNIRGASLHVMGDLLGSVGAIAAAIIIWLTGWTPIDPILSVFVSLLILRGAWALLMRTFNILMEGAPDGVDPTAITADLKANIPGLANVDHLHVWSLSSGRTMATLDISLTGAIAPATVSNAVRQRLAQTHDINHATIEIDWTGHGSQCAAAKPA